MSASTLLRVDGLRVRYQGADVLHGVDLHLDAGEGVALLGANGAGKSTLLKAVMGMAKSAAGTIEFAGTAIDGQRPDRIARLGLAEVPEGRRVFPVLTIAENLEMGAWVVRRDRAGMQERRDAMYERFPVLGRRRDQVAAALSGGEAQMLAIAMALMAQPKVLLLDEPSLGLAPVVVDEVFDVLDDLRRGGLPILLVEQNVAKALHFADRAYVLKGGRVVADGTSAELLETDVITEAYLG